MARIRTIKPEFWSSAKVGKISRDARLLFLGLLNEADDEGRLLGQTKRLAGIIFPFDDDMDASKIECLVGELQTGGMLQRYEIGGAIYLCIIGFSEHQKIDRRVASRLPAPPEITDTDSPTNSLSSEHSEFSPDKSAESTDKQAEHAEKTALYLGSRNRERDLGKGKGTDRSLALSLTRAGFVSEVFSEVWDRWRRHRSELRKPLGDIEEEPQIMSLAKFGQEEAIQIVEYTIGRGARNLILTGDHKDKSSDGQQTKQNRSGIDLRSLPV